MNKIKLIYNPRAGSKRHIFRHSAQATTLEEIKQLLDQYQIPVDYFPTKRPGHATELARDAIKEGYDTVIVAGGDGTVGEAANGLVDSKVLLGVLPMGSFMNVARMLSIPSDLEKAVEIIKIGRIRKIDVGCVLRLSGEELARPYYFLESCGLGLEAQLHEYVLEWERGDRKAIWRIFKTFFEYYGHKATLILDGKQEIRTRATLITVANGPFTATAIPLNPKAKLNDHLLTVSLFKMSKFELIKFVLRLISLGKASSPKVKTYQAKSVKIVTKSERLVHADARLFGTTPVSFAIKPNALNVITGFPKPGTSALISRTYLDS